MAETKTTTQALIKKIGLKPAIATKAIYYLHHHIGNTVLQKLLDGLKVSKHYRSHSFTDINWFLNSNH